MPMNTELARDQWARYAYCRDNGHTDFLLKADKCENFFAGFHWDPQDLATLRAQRRPALTINKIISTVSTIAGEQIFNRADTDFQPRAGSPADTAGALTKLFRQIGHSNQLQWVRSDVFCDGIIRSRGFFDVRLDFADSMRGEVRITQENGKNVVVDPDAEQYDPDTWNDVFTSKWLTTDDIALNYNEEDAKQLTHRPFQEFTYGYDSIEMRRDRFAGPVITQAMYRSTDENSMKVRRRIRVLERQYRRMTSQDHFVDLQTGDMRPVPPSWERNRIAHVAQTYGLAVVPKKIKRIRWCVTADNFVLHDDWSPYKHFTVVPYFPFFRHGRTLGIVEHLIGSQELLNKTTSQELHVVNTTANSGWKVKSGSLRNMDASELEQRGAQTGIVLELDEIDNAEKIQPNSIPTGLERLSYKAEEHIKGISNVSDSMQGFDREDVAAKAIQSKQVRSSVNFAAVMENLTRTDWLLARNVVDIVQEFYTEERIVNIIGESPLKEQETLVVNQITPEGEIANDLTIGEFDIVVTAVPYRDSLEDAQFDQGKELRELGIPIPDEFLVKNSRLLNKSDIAKAIEDQKNSEAAQADAALQQRGKEAEVAGLEAEANQKNATADKVRAEAAATAQGDGGEIMKAQLEAEIAREKMLMENQLAHEKMEREFALKEKQMMMEMELKQRQAVEEAKMRRAMMAQQAAMKPSGAEASPVN